MHSRPRLWKGHFTMSTAGLPLRSNGRTSCTLLDSYRDTEQPATAPVGSARPATPLMRGSASSGLRQLSAATGQAVVHEMAHHKLRAFGVANEQAIRIIANSTDELYPSPIVLDRLRPMTAVLHAQYSFIHVTQLDVQCSSRRTIQTSAVTFGSADRNASRMEMGFKTLRAHAHADESGRDFLGAFYDWCDTVLSKSRDLIS